MSLRRRLPRDHVTVGQILELGVGEAHLLASDSAVRANLSLWPPGDHFARMVGYLDSLPDRLRDGDGVLFYGPNGSGKTFTASHIAIGGYRLGYSVRFLSAPDLLDLLSPGSGLSDSVMDTCRDVDLLIIDDLGKEYRGKAGYFETKLDNILRSRCFAKLPTVITSNLTGEKFETIYQRTVADLLKECILPILFPDLNLRGHQLPALRSRVEGKP